MKRRILSIITALSLCLSLCPALALSAELSCGHDHSEDTSLSALLNPETDLVLTSGKYYLEENLAISCRLVISGGDVELCLNGHTLASTYTRSSAILQNGGSLILENGTINGTANILLEQNTGKLSIRNTTLAGGNFTLYSKAGPTELDHVTLRSSSTAWLVSSTANEAAATDCTFDGNVKLDGGTVSFSTVRSGQIIAAADAHITQLKNVTVEINSTQICLQNQGIIDSIEDCYFTTDSSGAINNYGTIGEITGGTYQSSGWGDGGALLNSGTVSAINGGAAFYGRNGIRNDGSGILAINDAVVAGTADDNWTVGFAISAYAVYPSSTGRVVINGGVFTCDGYKTDDLKLFPDNASGITVNGGRFQLPVLPSLLGPDRVSELDETDGMYVIGIPQYSITYNLDGGMNHPDNPPAYHSSAGVPELKAPTKDGYRFTGWKDSDGADVTAIQPGTSGAVTLFATWAEETVFYTVYLDDITGFTANQEDSVLVQKGASYSVTLTAQLDYLPDGYSLYGVTDERGNYVDNQFYYDSETHTAVIYVPNISSDVHIICQAKTCDHDFQETVLQPASCTETGSKKLSCQNCGAVMTPVEIPALGHSYSYSADGSRITELCENGCSHQSHAIIVVVNDAAVVSYGADWKGQELAVFYKKDGEPAAEPDGPGNYTASITIDGATAFVSWEIKNTAQEQSTVEIKEGLSGVPEALKSNPDLDTIEKIEAYLKSATVRVGSGITGNHVSIYNVTLMVSTDGGKTWEPATKENFPEDGRLTITLPYPAGTDSSFHFIVLHMFTTSDFNNIPGETEAPMITKRESGLRVTVTGLSPIAIGWSSNAGDPGTPEEPEKPENPSIPSTSNSGSGGSAVTYAVTVEKSEHGKVTSNRTNASNGSTVTLTVTPDSGYVLDVLTVTDSRGNEIKLTAQGGNKYTFTMPSRAVTVKASFVPLPDDTQKPCDGGADCPSRGFSDLGSVGTWYHEAVDYVLRNDLMGGYGNGLFGPNDNLSRAQFAQILFNKEGRPVVNYLLQYGDVAEGAWYTEAIRWATSRGIVGGYGNGMFGPNDNITREQLAVMLWRYAGSPAATDKELHFTDADQASGFALEALRWAVENGIINGYGNGQLAPQGLATRGQVAQMLMNFLKNR